MFSAHGQYHKSEMTHAKAGVPMKVHKLQGVHIISCSGVQKLSAWTLSEGEAFLFSRFFAEL